MKNIFKKCNMCDYSINTAINMRLKCFFALRIVANLMRCDRLNFNR